MAQKIMNADEVPALSLAYIGDSVYELAVRAEGLKRNNTNAERLNRFAKLYARASVQAVIAGLLKESFTEQELMVYKRGRNAKGASAPRTCTVSEYRRATGLEALMGWLYIEGQSERVRELILKGIELYEQREQE